MFIGRKTFNMILIRFSWWKMPMLFTCLSIYGTN